MIHHSSGVANPKLRLLIGLVIGVIATIAFQELSRAVTAALNYKAAKLFGSTIVAIYNRE